MRNTEFRLSGSVFRYSSLAQTSAVWPLEIKLFLSDMKNLFTSLLLCTALYAPASGLVYFESDFSSASPDSPLAGWSCYGSGKTASDTELGWSGANLRDYFPEGSPAYVMLDFPAVGIAAFSNSTTVEGGAVSEWLISPEIDLSEYDNNALLQFEVISYGSNNESRYDVYVSETGNSVDDFTGKAVYSGRQKGSAQYIVNSISRKGLKDVGGKKIWLAFVNKSDNAQLLGFRNIRLSEYDIEVVNRLEEFTTSEGVYSVDMSVSIMTPMSCKGFTAVLATADGHTQEYYCDKELGTRYNTYDFSFPTPLDVHKGDNIAYTVTITPNFEGASSWSCDYRLVCRDGYDSVCVMEEGTGTWCGYCVRGMAAIARYTDLYGDRFMAAAVHADDIMEVPSYLNPLQRQSGMSSFPSAWFNRKYLADPALNQGIVEEILNRKVGQKVSLDKVIYDEETHTATVLYSPEFCYSLDNAHVSAVAVLTEDGCHGSGQSWLQNNYYSGRTQEELASEGITSQLWEYLEWYTEEPPMLVNNDFDHVAWGIFNDYSGTQLPSSWQEGVSQQFSLSFELPMQETENGPGVQNWRNTRILVLLLDTRSGEILSADSLEASAYDTGGSDGVVSVPVAPVRIFSCGSSVTISAPEGGKAVIFTPDGRLLANLCIDADLPVSCDLIYNGMVIVQVENGNNKVVEKLMLTY